MTTLLIEIHWNGFTAIEVRNHDDIKYVETFQTWHELLDTLSQYMQVYATIEVRRVLPTDTHRYPINVVR